ncbi:hypothetical protein MON38_06025 [Hymenobacter sp. DH14]|uniref:STAS/SEC14 domain-containing protein n=1 Tax=Hymenobacter cyanobacteriorum TaxID=2926463 RepID=A0A9X2AHU7_9BACT|nr:hypothetical protein [Hymenobacter cyanobacteriorum]MCI1186969.1 hypothetical protein [Hymenobacter cyanobacteriorum]
MNFPSPSHPLSFAGLPIYFQNAVGRLLEHPAGYIVFQYHAGKRALADFQALLTHTGQLLRRRGWQRILADQRLMTPFTEAETAWVTSFWLDPANQPPGGLHAAVMLADDVFARLATNTMRETLQSAALTYRLFKDEATATAWLMQVG